MMRASRACHGVYRGRWIILAFMLSLLTLCLLAQTSHRGARMLAWANDLTVQSPSVADKFAQKSPPQSTKKMKRDLHIVLPATKSSVHMCKTMLSMAILDYPKPHIVAWGDDSGTKALIGGGSHYAKITRTLDYINDKKRRQKPGFDDELVFMLDAYDIWFQLPVEVLLERYHNIVEEENERVKKRMGRAFDIEKIHSSIIFGGGKRCAPNFIYSLACYPVPDSPISKDIRQQNTDTAMGRNQWSSFRTRYLNSGYIIGPIREMRPLLEKAKQRLEECIDRKGVEWDDGYGGSNRCYGGSDQSIFVEMFGEQEFQREVMRRHHRRIYDGVLEKLIPDRAGANPPPTHIMNTPIDDLLDPAFSHQAHEAKYLENNPYEMGIAIDYWSLLGHQTSNAEDDGRYIQYDKPVDEQIGRLNRFDCVPKTQFPPELATGQIPFPNKDAATWKSVPLYTEICVGSTPVMIHHNSIDKSQRERQWHKTWWHGQSRTLFNQRNNGASAFLTRGFPTDSGETVSWNELCPRDVEPELFRDVSMEEVEKEQKEKEQKQKEEQEQQQKQQVQEKQQQEENAAQEQKGQKELAKKR